jgi:hypothetical protein
LRFSGIDGALDVQQQPLHVARPRPLHLLVDEDQLTQVVGIA